MVLASLKQEQTSKVSFLYLWGSRPERQSLQLSALILRALLECCCSVPRQAKHTLPLSAHCHSAAQLASPLWNNHLPLAHWRGLAEFPALAPPLFPRRLERRSAGWSSESPEGMEFSPQGSGSKIFLFVPYLVFATQRAFCPARKNLWTRFHALLLDTYSRDSHGAKALEALPGQNKKTITGLSQVLHQITEHRVVRQRKEHRSSPSTCMLSRICFSKHYPMVKIQSLGYLTLTDPAFHCFL